MPDHIRTSRVFVARPRSDVFAFFAEPANLGRVSPSWVGVGVLRRPSTLDAGAVVDYRVRLLGVPVRWRAFIREWDPPVRFVDVQLRGPYARWEHRHLFLEGDGGTWIEDRVIYQLRLGGVGRLAHGLIVRRMLDALWRYRERRIGELLRATTPAD